MARGRARSIWHPALNVFISRASIRIVLRVWLPGMQMAEKRVLVKINKDKTELTLREVLEKIKELQEKNPDMEVFFDGDQYAICGRIKKAPE